MYVCMYVCMYVYNLNDSGLEDASYDRLSHRVSLKSFAAGSTIYTQGQLPEYAYIILFGAVSISVSV